MACDINQEKPKRMQNVYDVMTLDRRSRLCHSRRYYYTTKHIRRVFLNAVDLTKRQLVRWKETINDRKCRFRRMKESEKTLLRSKKVTGRKSSNHMRRQALVLSGSSPNNSLLQIHGAITTHDGQQVPGTSTKLTNTEQPAPITKVDNRIISLQRNADNLVHVMEHNVIKMLQRYERLSVLYDRSENMKNQADLVFEKCRKLSREQQEEVGKVNFCCVPRSRVILAMTCVATITLLAVILLLVYLLPKESTYLKVSSLP